MLESQSGPFMSGEVIFLAVMLNASTVGMGGEVMVLSSYLVRFLHNPVNALVAPFSWPTNHSR